MYYMASVNDGAVLRAENQLSTRIAELRPQMADMQNEIRTGFETQPKLLEQSWEVK